MRSRWPKSPAWLFVAAFCVTNAVAQVLVADIDAAGSVDFGNIEVPGSRKFLGGSSIPIAGTNESNRFATHRLTSPGVAEFTYALTGLPDGAATLALEFAESKPDQCAAGKRVFSVAVGGAKVLTDFDVYVGARNACQSAIVKTFPVKIADGKLNVTFLRGPSGDAMIAGIKLLTGSSSLLDVDAGGPTDLPTTEVLGSRTYSGNSSIGIGGTVADDRFRTHRLAVPGGSEFKYTLPNLPNGPAILVLEFAESKTGNCGAGKRVFSVAANGANVLTNFDVYVAAGNQCHKAVAKTFLVNVAGGKLDVTFVRGSAGDPMISGIRVFPGSAVTTAPPTSTSAGICHPISGNTGSEDHAAHAVPGTVSFASVRPRRALCVRASFPIAGSVLTGFMPCLFLF
jgi:Malectin domain